MVAKETAVSLPNWYFSKVNYVITHLCQEMYILRCMPHFHKNVTKFLLSLSVSHLIVTLGLVCLVCIEDWL